MQLSSTSKSTQSEKQLEKSNTELMERLKRNDLFGEESEEEIRKPHITSKVEDSLSEEEVVIPKVLKKQAK
jgi:hypothetical protein